MHHKKIFSLPKSVWAVLLISNAVYAWCIHSKLGSYRGWTVVDISSDLTINLPTILAVFQFVLFGFTVDTLMRLIVVTVNRRLSKGQVPVLAVTVLSILIYSVIGLIAFILLYDHSLSHILATTGALGVGAVFVFREWIADVTASIQIQTDHLAGIDDYLLVTGDSGLLKVVQIDHRMITVQDDSDYLIRIPTRQFLDLKYINLSRQPLKRGIGRSCTFQLSSQNNSSRVIEMMETTMKYITSKDHRFYYNYSCQILKIEGGAIAYGICYECDPTLSEGASNSLVFERLLHIFRAAAVNLGSDMEITSTAVDISEAQQRLMDIYRSSVLKVLEDHQVIQLAATIKIIRYGSGERLITQGEYGESMYFISEGHLEVSIPGKDGKEIVVATLWPGDCVGEMSLLTGEHRSANVSTQSKVVLLEVTKNSLLPLFEESPELIDEISKILTDRKLANEKALLTSNDSKEISNQVKAFAQKIVKFFFGTKN
jgi:hypothetical protein